jgi:hypothetical protein
MKIKIIKIDEYSNMFGFIIDQKVDVLNKKDSKKFLIKNHKISLDIADRLIKNGNAKKIGLFIK